MNGKQNNFLIVGPLNWLVSVFILTVLLGEPLFGSQITPVFLNDFSLKDRQKEGVPWTPPNYTGQVHRVGYSAKAFQPTTGLMRRYNFWKDIYSKYDSDQGVLHDAEEIDLVYKVIDLPTMESTGQSRSEVEKLRTEVVESEKRKVERTLLKLQLFSELKKNPNDLKSEEKRIWDVLNQRKEKKKFYLATKDNRLRLQLGQKDQFLNAIYYSGRYLSEIEKIFEEYNLPKELTRLPIVESSFNVLAQSRVGASGLWQFMRYTARGRLKMNRYVDERNDPIKSTRAAARMLKWGYKKNQAWPLAVTGYNYGMTGIYRLSNRFKTKSLSDIIEKEESSRFGFASQNFYASFLAALEVEKNARQYFKTPLRSRPLKAKKLKLTKSVAWKSLLSWFGNDPHEARIYNPSVTYKVRSGRAFLPRNTEVYVPTRKWSLAKKEMKRLPAAKVTRHKVRRGETLGHIARRFGVSLKSIMKVNRISKANRIFVGQTLKIP